MYPGREPPGSADHAASSSSSGYPLGGGLPGYPLGGGLPASPKNRKTRVRKKGHITWDEQAIAEHDKERGTRQKIDEPDTPFVRSPMTASDTEEGAASSDAPSDDECLRLAEFSSAAQFHSDDLPVQRQGVSFEPAN